jgi:hypothetical protein
MMNAGRGYLASDGIKSCGVQQFPHPLARIMHARLNGAGGRSDDLSNLCDCFLVIVDEIKDFPVRRRKL